MGHQYAPIFRVLKNEGTMLKKDFIFLFLSLLLGSFSDEAVQIIFALQLGDANKIYLTSMLLLLGMLGGLLSNVFYSKISQYFNTRSLIFNVLFFESLLIILSSFLTDSIFYLFISFFLGVLGGILWSSVLILIPEISSNNENTLEKINKYAHLIRNMGFMVGPVLGGGLTHFTSQSSALIMIGLLTFLSSLAIWQINHQETEKREKRKAINGFKSIPLLLKDSEIFKAILPLVLTIICTSTLSVLLVVYITDIVKLNGTQYGIFSSAISLSLAICPLFLVKWLKIFNEPASASLSASFIGLSLLLLSLTNNFYLLVIFGMLMGAFNGAQNTIMSAFMLKKIPTESRENLMPAYVLILQSCVVVGFILSMFIQSQQISATFILFSTITLLSGMVSFFLNCRTSFPQSD